MTDILFVYGTLLQQSNSYAIYLKHNSTYLCPGKLKGLLYDISEYPGAVITTGFDEYIYGSVLKLHHPKESLIIIDDYEGFGPEQDQPNLYTRLMASVETDKGPINAWVYSYNLPVDGLQKIPSGNYTEYIRQKKSPGS